jgi:hypothetical protein
MGQTIAQKKLSHDLDMILTNEEARLVKNRYRTIRKTLQYSWTALIDSVGKETMLNFLKDVVYLDRKLRLQTEGEEDELKEQLAQEKQIELGYGIDIHKKEFEKQLLD